MKAKIIFSILFLFCIYNLKSQTICGLTASYGPDFTFPDCYPEASGSYLIPVYFHELRHSILEPTENIKITDVNKVIDLLNETFSGYGLNITFVAAQFDEKGNCFSGYKSHLFNETVVYNYVGTDLRNIFNNTPGEFDYILNHYFNIWLDETIQVYLPQYNFYDEVGGIAIFPPSIPQNDRPSNINSSNIFVSQNNFLYAPLTVNHEIGHSLGLYHVFQDSCNAINDCMHGDMIESIPSCQELIINSLEDCDNNFICSSNTPYPVDNIMSYAGLCVDKFYEEQFKRMSSFINEFSYLTSSSNISEVILGSNNPNLLNNPYTFSSPTNYVNQTYTANINGVINVDADITFNGCTFYMNASSKIVIKSGRNVTFQNCDLTSPDCSGLLWDGIIVEEGASLEVKSGSLIQDAYIGISANKNSTLTLSNLNINSCYIGITFNNLTRSIPPTQSNNIVLKYQNIIINGTHNLKNHITFQVGNQSYAGIVANDCSTINLITTTTLKNQFNNLKYGIKTFATSTILEYALFNNCEYGIFASSSAKSKYYINIKKNIFENCTYDMDVSNATINVIENSIAATDKQMRFDKCFGGKIINNTPNVFGIISLELLNSSNITIENNQISAEFDNLISNCNKLILYNNSFDGLTLTNVRDSELKENTISKVGGSLYDGPAKIDGGNNLIFDCNNYIGGDFDALLIDNSPDNTFRCNLFEGGPSSLTFQGNNPSTDLEANTITTGDIGLFLQGSDSEFGPQEDKGNIFSGTFSDIGARNDNDFFAESLVTNDEAAQYNPTHSPNEWFLNNSEDKPAVCEPACQGSGPGSNLIPWYGEKYARCLDSLFNSTKYARYSTKAKWNLLFILYRKNYLRDTSVIKYSPCIKALIETYKNTALHKAVDVYDKMLLPATPDYSGVESSTEELVAAIENEEDITAELDEVKDKTQDYIDSVGIIVKNYFDDLEDAVDNLGDLSAERDAVSKVGVIAPLFYKYYSEEEITSNEIDDLIEVAESCARDVGPSKYYAMALLQSLYVSFNNTICVEEEEPRKGKDNEVIINNSNVDFVTANLYDINGRFISAIRNSDEIYKRNLSTGLYILTYITSDNKIISKKLFIP